MLIAANATAVNPDAVRHERLLCSRKGDSCWSRIKGACC